VARPKDVSPWSSVSCGGAAAAGAQLTPHQRLTTFALLTYLPELVKLFSKKLFFFFACNFTKKALDLGMIKNDKQVNGFIAKVNIVDRKSGDIIQKNVMMKCEHHASIEDLNRDLAKFGLPRKFELVEWIA